MKSTTSLVKDKDGTKYELGPEEIIYRLALFAEVRAGDVNAINELHEAYDAVLWNPATIEAKYPGGYDVTQFESKINYWGELNYEPEHQERELGYDSTRIHGNPGAGWQQIS